MYYANYVSEKARFLRFHEFKDRFKIILHYDNDEGYGTRTFISNMELQSLQKSVGPVGPPSIKFKGLQAIFESFPRARGPTLFKPMIIIHLHLCLNSIFKI